MSFKFKKKLKKLLTTIFILGVFLTFASLTVIVIIIAQGGKISPEGISKTGIIHMNVQPDKDIKVYVNDKLVDAKNQKIENLETGTYQVRIEKEKYTSWTKDVEVEEGVVSEIFATLFPTDLKLEQLTSTNIDRTFYSPDGNYVLYTVKDAAQATTTNSNSSGIWKLKLNQSTFGLVENKPERILSLNTNLKEALSSDYSIQISPNNERFLLTTDKVQLIYSMSGNGNPVSLPGVTNIGFLSDKLTWFRQGGSLIVEKNKEIFEYNIQDNTTQHIFTFASTPLYTVNGRSLVFYAEGKFYLYNNNEKTILTHLKDINLPAASEIWLSHNSDEILYVKSGKILYFVNLKKTIKTIGEFNIVQLSPNGASALIQDKKGQLFVFRSEYIAAKNTVKTSVKMISENYSPQNATYIWSPDSLQIIRKQGNVITMIDKYGENMHDILNSEQIYNNDFYLANNSSDFVILLKDSMVDSTAAANSNSKAIVNPQNNNLYRIKLVQ
jgi:hypothetical protein